MNYKELLEKDIDSLSKSEREMVEAVLEGKAEVREEFIQMIASMIMAAMKYRNVSAEEAVDYLRIDPEIRGEVLNIIRERTGA
ncbi:MAG: hypothetical protein E7Z69_05700 [Thermoplasmata archaeon]|jgi:vacuolar-type H+-ATPase subunit D/Vma8|nr:hypothetical protein [Thermoplasmata archaeon]